tara:strand:- start:492 stop:1757 length:1266 start_codon:yes stop_codon:yes gene_type:complete
MKNKIKDRNTRVKKARKKQIQDEEASRMMNAATADLDVAVEATKHDVYYDQRETEYPKDAEHDEWKQTGFWGGYHTQGGDEVEAAREISDELAKQEAKIHEEALEAAKENVTMHLGQTSKYPQNYDASVLVRELRQNNRAHLNILNTDNFFLGSDLWNAYEVSCLTQAGMPVAAVGQILYPASSNYIVESKSLKLYLNSFNMTRLGTTPTTALEIMVNTVQADLSHLLETDVQVNLQMATNPFTLEYKKKGAWAPDNIFSSSSRQFTPDICETLETTIDVQGVRFDQYEESPQLLEGAQMPSTHFFHSSLLKSNCKVTHQPDWGDVFIYINSPYKIDKKSLLQYIVSFRHENHFHEEICETIYKRLHDKFTPAILGVACLYTRRGGIDINPVRVSSTSLLAPGWTKNGVLREDYHLKLYRQ